MSKGEATGKAPARGGRAAETRKRLLEAADALFYAGGIRATGVEAVAEKAGVTKMTLYSHFSSKDELVAAYLEERDLRWRESLESSLEGLDDPDEKLLAVFDAYREQLVVDGLRGCAYINCAAEFPERGHPAREVVRRHKATFRRHLTELATEAGAKDPEGLAERLFLLLEGSYVTGALEGDEEVVGRARELAAELVAAAVGDESRRGR
jgi:AcrR family transcriptional regulator